MSRTKFVWLEITGKCQLECRHCYANSGPAGSHGTMTLEDWARVIGEAADLGVEMVQFIGGEPALHPGLPQLIEHAVDWGLDVEVYSNLVHVPAALWDTFSRHGVRLACSYYSDDPAQHAAVTGRARSHARTRANIVEAVRRSIPLRVGVVQLEEEQRAQEAMVELAGLGVTNVGYDRMRQVGRGVRDEESSMDQLCGHCASGVLAISPSGEVWPCVFARWMPVGNVLTASMAEIMAGQQVVKVRDRLTEHFDLIDRPCVPEMCDPQCGPNCSPACNPQGSANPCGPRGGCKPNYE